MFEVITDWTVNSHSGLVTVMYFNETSPIATVRSSINTLYTNVNGVLSNTAAWVIRPTGRQIQAEDGALLGIWTDATARSGAGVATAASVADATQVLLRWGTGAIVNSRFVRGRTFIPGYTSAGILAGNLASSSVTTFNNAATQFANDPNGFVIWSRPFAGTPGSPGEPARAGSSHQVVTGTVWPELAVLRRRRL